MSDRFIRFIPGPKNEYLLIHHHNAYILYSYLVQHARYTDEIQDGLLPGDAIMPGWQKLKFSSEKVYRNAWKKLVELGYIEVVYNMHGKVKVQKRTIKRAIESFVVNICSKEIYAINYKLKGEWLGDRGAIEGRHKKKEQERIKENEKNSSKSFMHKPINGVGGAPSSGNDQNASSDNVCHVPAAAAAAFSKSLENVDIPDDDKAYLTKKYSDEDIAEAVKYSKTAIIKKSLAATLKWYCALKDKPQVADPEWAKEYALKFESWKSRGWKIEAYSKQVEFICSGQSPPIVINYKDQMFKTKFDEALKNKGFKKNG